MAGIYVHIPFCGQFCTYCAFYSVTGRGYREKYIQALSSEIERKKDFFRPTGVSPQTIYFGGGTPSVFPPHVLGGVVRQLVETFAFRPEEVTVEVNPNDITPEYAHQLHAAGFNRVSMGVQSFTDAHLVWMNRRHRGAEAVQAYRNLREAGFGNISMDLIFGFGGLTGPLWRENIRTMAGLSPEHISAYQLSIEPGSALSAMVRRGEYVPVPDETCHREYDILQEELSQAGYLQYEISNFAKSPHFRSRHNSAYWTKSPYLGLGPAAHSYDGRNRGWNHPSVARYCRYFNGKPDTGERISAGVAGLMLPAVSGGVPAGEVWGYEELSRRDIFNESVMLGLRTVDGVDLSRLDRDLLEEAAGEIRRHEQWGDLLRDGRKIRIPSDRLFVSDGIIRDLFV